MQVQNGLHHVGILYKIDGASTKLTHMAWHHKLLIGRMPDSRYDWLQCGLDEINRKAVAAALVGMETTLELPVPYSINYEGIYFQPETMIYSRKEPGEGLTCATFIDAFFRSLGLELIVLESWPPRASDAVWQGEIVKALRQSLPDIGADAEHIRRQEERIGSPRYRPEEIAAAVSSETPPMVFADAERLGGEILAAMRQGS